MNTTNNFTQPKETDKLPPNITFYDHELYPLYCEGRVTWNRYMLSQMIAGITAVPDAMKEFTPLSGIERAALASKIGSLPVWGTVIGFGQIDFWDEVNFSGFFFPTNVSFDTCNFHSQANFDNTIFSKQANFTDCTFHDSASFESCEFSGLLAFYSVRALQAISFRHSTFRQCLFSANDTSASFCDVDFTGARFLERVGFEDVVLGGAANFNNVHFLDRTSFERVSFVEVPTFHNALIHPDTTFHRARFPTRNPQISQADAEERAWRTLKQAMNKVNNQESELRFFCREMSARIYRLRDEGRVAESFCLMLYRTASVYGTSFLRPLIALGIMSLVFAIYYTFEIVFILGVGKIGHIFWQALRVSASTALNPTNLKVSFDLLSTMAGPTSITSQWYVALSIQVFLSAIALFLLALSIRNHFSMK
ncbi:pentapeptide repeat-containing protein [Duganella sp. PWIR1]